MLYDYCVFIGRFQPPHKGHFAILNKALEIASSVIVILGSYTLTRSSHNPWLAVERKAMMRLALPTKDKDRVQFLYVQDRPTNDTWISIIRQEVSSIAKTAKVALIGFNSDASSFYLDFFPEWQYISCPTEYDFHSTDIRQQYFDGDEAYKKCLHPKVAGYLEAFSQTDEFRALKNGQDR